MTLEEPALDLAAVVLFRDVKPQAGMGGSHVEERVITGSDELSSGGRLHVVSGALEVLIFSIVLLKI